MKTLINKTNPQIRITAPEFKISESDPYYDYYYTPVDRPCELPLTTENWTLVDEEPPVEVEPEDLEKAAEEYEAEMWRKIRSEGIDGIATPSEDFMAGAKWMEERIKGGKK